MEPACKIQSIPLARPNITQAEIDAVVAVLRTPHLSLGPKLGEFEAAFARYCRRSEAVACSSGTAGLHLLIRSLGVGPGDEIITTPFSFIASANCVLMEGARPAFVDIDPATWNIDPNMIEPAISPRTKGVLAVDVFGQVADMDRILEIARRRGLWVLEDACEALGGRFRGSPAGSFGIASVFGFYPNKQITTGEGGMVLTDDRELAELCRSLRNQGRGSDGAWLAHRRLGFNYRLSELQCALGLVQLARIGEILRTRQRVAQWYRQRLADEPRVRMQAIRADVEMSWFVFVVGLAENYKPGDRDRIIGGLGARGIECSNYFAPIHLQPFYAEQFGYRGGEFPICEELAERTIALPFHHEIREEDVDRICRELQRLL